MHRNAADHEIGDEIFNIRCLKEPHVVHRSRLRGAHELTRRVHRRKTRIA